MNKFITPGLGSIENLKVELNTIRYEELKHKLRSIKQLACIIFVNFSIFLSAGVYILAVAACLMLVMLYVDETRTQQKLDKLFLEQL